MATNPFLLAAENSPDLLPLLRDEPALASQQDEHGYSLVHAAASYNHLDLLRVLIRDFGVDVNIRDEDGESALFVVETVEAARVLVEELGADMSIRGSEGTTPREKIEAEGDFTTVSRYLSRIEAGNRGSTQGNGHANGSADTVESTELPPVPEGISISIGTMDQTVDVPDEPDPEFRRRIEELAERDDFHTESGQAELRRLVEDAISGQGLTDKRNVRQRQD